MSGLYNMLFGQHSNSNQLLELIGLTEDQIPRYRSCYWNGEYIVVHTRTGGGNREYYESKCEDNPEGPCNENLRAVEGYSHDEDDDFDCTYADFFFKPSEVAMKLIGSLPPDVSPAEQWQMLFKALDEAKK